MKMCLVWSSDLYYASLLLKSIGFPFSIIFSTNSGNIMEYKFKKVAYGLDTVILQKLIEHIIPVAFLERYSLLSCFHNAC